MNALSAFCLQRLGYDPYALSPDELRPRIPEIALALAERIEVLKSVALSAGRYVPPMTVREESVSFESVASADRNACLTTLFPFDGE
jgi:hypothetical protein